MRGLYSVLQRLRAKYPRVPMMLCSGGGGRADYELLRYFTEFRTETSCRVVAAMTLRESCGVKK